LANATDELHAKEVSRTKSLFDLCPRCFLLCRVDLSGEILIKTEAKVQVGFTTAKLARAKTGQLQRLVIQPLINIH
jgi:hypothetical protein